MMKYKLSIFLLAGLVAGMGGRQVSWAGFEASYGALGQPLQTVNFSGEGGSIVGQTNAAHGFPVYDVTATGKTTVGGSIVDVTLDGNGGNVKNKAVDDGLTYVSFVAQAGYAWTAFDFMLDSMNKTIPYQGGVLKFDFYVNSLDSSAADTWTLDFPYTGSNGEDQKYLARATNGDRFSRLDITYTPSSPYLTNTIHDFHNIDVVTAPVPEPASIAMWGLGAMGMMFARRRRHK